MTPPNVHNYLRDKFTPTSTQVVSVSYCQSFPWWVGPEEEVLILARTGGWSECDYTEITNGPGECSLSGPLEQEF